WVEHTPEAGSYLETIFNALQEVYALSDISGEGGGAGSFGQEFLNYFNNNKNNVTLFNTTDIPPFLQRQLDRRNQEIKSSVTLNLGNWAYIALDMNLEIGRASCRERV